MNSAYVAYKFRWVVLLTYCIVNAANAIQWIAFAPITSLTMVYFGISAEEVNGLSICYMALYLPGTFLAMFLFSKYSLRQGFLVGAMMQLIGSWVRYGSSFAASPAGFGGLLFGQCLSGLAQPFFTNTPAQIASRWFPSK